MEIELNVVAGLNISEARRAFLVWGFWVRTAGENYKLRPFVDVWEGAIGLSQTDWSGVGFCEDILVKPCSCRHCISYHCCARQLVGSVLKVVDFCGVLQGTLRTSTTCAIMRHA